MKVGSLRRAQAGGLPFYRGQFFILFFLILFYFTIRTSNSLNQASLPPSYPSCYRNNNQNRWNITKTIVSKTESLYFTFISKKKHSIYFVGTIIVDRRIFFIFIFLFYFICHTNYKKYRKRRRKKRKRSGEET